MNYEVNKCEWISGDLWECSLKVWKIGSCGCTAKIYNVEINSATRPSLEDIKKAALV